MQNKMYDRTYENFSARYQSMSNTLDIVADHMSKDTETE